MIKARRFFAIFTMLCFTSTVLMPVNGYAAAAGALALPAPGTMVTLSAAYQPALIKGMTVHPDNALMFDFIVASGEHSGDLRTESQKMIKYFLAALAVPEKEMWVNLSPYEKDRIVPETLGGTEMGRDMLAQDYILKQLTASMFYPKDGLGKEFWSKVYAQARETYGTKEIPVNTFNKVWILPDQADIFTRNNTVWIVGSHLKVMLEEDYLAMAKNANGNDASASAVKITNITPNAAHALQTKVVRELIIPAIEKEVNEGAHFANLRQIYQSLILAAWYKKNLKDALLNQVYTDTNKISGVAVEDKDAKLKIYRQYLEAYKKGVFNLIQQDTERLSKQPIARKYFSGGEQMTEVTKILRDVDVTTAAAALDANKAQLSRVQVNVQQDNAMNVDNGNLEQMAKLYGISLDDALYYQSLVAKRASNSASDKPVMRKNYIPSALMTSDVMNERLGVFEARDVLNNLNFSAAARNVNMTVMELKGGIGSSVIRSRTLQRLLNRTQLADKGSDMMYEDVEVHGFDRNGNDKVFRMHISVAEARVLNYIETMRQGALNSIAVQELVNDESEGPVNSFWDQPYLNDRIDDRIPTTNKKTYRQLFAQELKLSLVPEFIKQGNLPVLDADNGGQIIENKKLWAPGGHGFFAVLTMFKNAKNTKDLSEPNITVFTNGDGTNNALPAPIAGLMVEKRLPIVMVTTTKQLIDLKGGLIGLMAPKDLPDALKEKMQRGEKLTAEEIAQAGVLYPSIMELAQAKDPEVKQEKLFKHMGITVGSGQLFNTNIHAQNHNILDPFLADLRTVIGEDKFKEIIAPDLIANPKKKKIDEKEYNVLQLEGASGSALLALNRFIMTTNDPKVLELKRKHRIDRLVYFVNFDESLRSMVFTPEKYSWDHYLYSSTSLFKFNPKTGRLEFNPATGRTALPGLDLDKYYEDMENNIIAFGKMDNQRLDYLGVRGVVHMADAVLKGGVFIVNKTGKMVDLNTMKEKFAEENGRLLLDNVYITIEQNGEVTVTKPTDLLATVEAFESVNAAMLSEEDTDLTHISTRTDSAVSVNPADYGGINLDVDKLRMNATGEAINMTFNPAQLAQFKTGNFTGLVPVIINITPFTDPKGLLGLK